MCVQFLQHTQYDTIDQTIINLDIHIIAEPPYPTPPNLHDTYKISCPPHLLPLPCIQPMLSLV